MRELDSYYANAFQIGYRLYEIVIDFGQAADKADRAQWGVRVTLSPLYAKDLAHTLAEVVQRYEEEHGEIPADRSSDENWGNGTEH